MNHRILIIDDEAEILNSLSAVLQDEGYITFTAKNGNEGLKILQEEIINLVLLDLRLPDIDGIEVLRRIKELEPDIAVIMISGNATIETALNQQNLGQYFISLKNLFYPT